jgi:hypothetical protein
MQTFIHLEKETRIKAEQWAHITIIQNMSAALLGVWASKNSNQFMIGHLPIANGLGIYMNAAFSHTSLVWSFQWAPRAWCQWGAGLLKGNPIQPNHSELKWQMVQLVSILCSHRLLSAALIPKVRLSNWRRTYKGSKLPSSCPRRRRDSASEWHAWWARSPLCPCLWLIT